MSYIRSTESPERLYVFGSGNDVLEMHWNDKVKYESVVVSQEEFDRLMELYSHWSHSDDILKVKGITLIPPIYPQESRYTLIFTDYLDLELKLWSVTLDSLANTVRRRRFRASWRERLRFLFDKLKW